MANENIATTAEKVGSLRPPSKAHSALKNSLMTAKEKVPLETLKKIDLFTKNYWGSCENAK